MLLRSACAAVEPELIGTRSSTASGTAGHDAASRTAWPAAAVRGPGARAACCPRSRCGRRRAPAAAARPCRRTRRGPPGVMCGTRMNPSLASACTRSLIASATVAGDADERLPAGDLDDQLADRQLACLRLGPPLRRGGQRVPVHPHAGPAAGDGVLARVGIDVRQRAVRVVAGQVPVPQLLEERDRGLPADLLAAHLAGQFGRLGVGVAEHEGRGRAGSAAGPGVRPYLARRPLTSA